MQDVKISSFDVYLNGIAFRRYLNSTLTESNPHCQLLTGKHIGIWCTFKCLLHFLELISCKSGSVRKKRFGLDLLIISLGQKDCFCKKYVFALHFNGMMNSLCPKLRALTLKRNWKKNFEQKLGDSSLELATHFWKCITLTLIYRKQHSKVLGVELIPSFRLNFHCNWACLTYKIIYTDSEYCYTKLYIQILSIAIRMCFKSEYNKARVGWFLAWRIGDEPQLSSRSVEN